MFLSCKYPNNNKIIAAQPVYVYDGVPYKIHCLYVLFFFYLEEGFDGRHMADTFSSAVLIHIITNLFDVDRRDCVRSDTSIIFKRTKLSNKHHNINQQAIWHYVVTPLNILKMLELKSLGLVIFLYVFER